MAFRFRKSVKVAPGIRLNFSKSGVSTSIGGRGARVNFSKRGVRTTVGLPGTGLSYSRLHKSAPNQSDKPLRSSGPPNYASPVGPGTPPRRSNIALWLLIGIVVAIGMAGLSGKSDKADEIVSPDSAVSSTSSPAGSPSNAYTSAMAPVMATAVQRAPSSTQPPTRYVQPKSLNVRRLPNGAITGSVKRGDAVTVHFQSGDWSRISPDGQPQRWVSSAYLCERRDCSDFQKPMPTPASARVKPAPARKAVPASPSYGCPCSSSSNCYGPRGGRYCITSGGNKRYR